MFRKVEEMYILPNSLTRKEHEVIDRALLEYIVIEAKNNESNDIVEVAKNLFHLLQSGQKVLTKIEHTILKTALTKISKLSMEGAVKIDELTLEKVINEVNDVDNSS